MDPDQTERAIREFAFDIVMGELNMDEGDMDDLAYAVKTVDEWMEHWHKTGAKKLAREVHRGS